MYTSHMTKPSRTVGPRIKTQQDTNMRQKKLTGHYCIKTLSSGEHCKLHFLYPTQSMLKSAVYILFKFHKQLLTVIKFGHQMNTGTKGRLQIQHVHEEVYNYQENQENHRLKECREINYKSQHYVIKPLVKEIQVVS